MMSNLLFVVHLYFDLVWCVVLGSKADSPGTFDGYVDSTGKLKTSSDHVYFDTA